MCGMDRRTFMAAGAGALWLPWDVREADARARRRVPFAREGTFADGVLSGDPSPTAVTFWTRLDASPPSPRMRALPRRAPL